MSRKKSKVKNGQIQCVKQIKVSIVSVIYMSHHVSKHPYAPGIQIIRSELQFFSAHVSGVVVTGRGWQGMSELLTAEGSIIERRFCRTFEMIRMDGIPNGSSTYPSTDVT